MKFTYKLLALLAWPVIVHGGSADSFDSLAGQSLEALLDTEVSSVLKHASGLADAPAAVTVLRREDIERLGATTLPDLLRVVPGLAVAQVDGNKWAIGSRGFNGFFNSKLLVLIDGRSIYNATFAGVFWDAYDIPLDTIARIEVIRGPAGVLWGSNAVNGVINIVTRPAQETQGGQLSLAAGNVENHRATLRYGGENDTAAWRIYASSRDRDEQKLASGASPGDTTRADRVGFRADSQPGGTTWMLTGDAYQGRSGGAPYPEATTDDLRGEHLLGRLNHRLSPVSNLQIQAYYDHGWRRDLAVGSVLDEHVFDFDALQDVELSPSHRLTWGGGWRQYRFATVSSSKLSFDPGSRTTAVSNLFLQDEWTLLPRELMVVAGLRAEHLPDNGLQWQPNLRAVWTPVQDHSFWAASGKAVRAPNKVNNAIRYCGPIGVNFTCNPAGGGNIPPAVGNPDFRPESVVSLEAGWRARLNPRLSSDLAVYRNRYRRLETIELRSDFSGLSYYNHGRGTTEGLEWALDWQAAENWQLRGGLTLYREHLRFAETPATPGPIISFHDSFPNRQAFLRSLWDISARHRLDLTLRGVGPLHNRGVSGYGTADLQWTWRYDRRLQFSLIGRNIGGPEHREIGDQPFFQETLLRREIVGTMMVTF